MAHFEQDVSKRKMGKKRRTMCKTVKIQSLPTGCVSVFFLILLQIEREKSIVHRLKTIL